AGSHRVRATFAESGDVDFYTFTLSAPAFVRIETYDAIDTSRSPFPNTVSTRCYKNETLLQLSKDGEVIFEDDDGGDRKCSAIAPVEGLPAGTYTIAVTVFDEDLELITTPSPYYLLVQLGAPVCGDGLKQGTEECDDGNTTNDDRCSSVCTIEASTV